MEFIDEQLVNFKNMIENAIKEKGATGKESVIRSQALINLIHDAVKHQLILEGIKEENIYPPLFCSKPELKLAGYLKQKDQDVCVIPSHIEKVPTKIDWGPLSFENANDPYGFEFSTNTLVINVRSQMSSLSKNADTLFERTFAEAQNLHMRYKQMVLGEVYLIPTHEYDDELVKHNTIGFKDNPVKIEKYISFFNSISNRKSDGTDYCYERCALLIVDFNRKVPKLYTNTAELKRDHLISDEFEIEYENISFKNFIKDLLDVYSERYDINNLKREK